MTAMAWYLQHHLLTDMASNIFLSQFFSSEKYKTTITSPWLGVCVCVCDICTYTHKRFFNVCHGSTLNEFIYSTMCFFAVPPLPPTPDWVLAYPGIVLGIWQTWVNKTEKRYLPVLYQGKAKIADMRGWRDESGDWDWQIHIIDTMCKTDN